MDKGEGKQENEARGSTGSAHIRNQQKEDQHCAHGQCESLSGFLKLARQCPVGRHDRGHF